MLGESESNRANSGAVTSRVNRMFPALPELGPPLNIDMLPVLESPASDDFERGNPVAIRLRSSRCFRSPAGRTPVTIRTGGRGADVDHTLGGSG